ncbi:MBL fold metallo-hydrolase [Halomonas sp. ZH2S]|uniref:MBL fold metallo-hydrolase n=1 Tax=Vreelandella zhuhanensis TaxID=2684210 RepID=A0A7X3GZC1_9GAMM|nr:MBL fold metallo-hydrolase [Halomonas zhuhanensis]MWJ27648.1 MBL fold metallo-hydrolase [Halomonas zhuhanensis]
MSHPASRTTSFPQFLHHGGADGVTGSCHQLLANENHSLLVDCGLFQGEDAAQDAFAQLEVNFDISTLRALIVTHVHIDHIGRLPYLLAAGYAGPILCSKPSALLLPLVIEDALKIGFTRDTRLIEQFQQRVESQLVPLDYGQWHTLVDDDSLLLQAKLKRAGHILGSSYVEVSLHDRVQGGKQRVVFSGDLGAPYSPLLPAPKSPYFADSLVLESTYGDRLHAPRRDRQQALKAAIEKALESGGTVIIPAFSIGRTQELLYELEGLILAGSKHAETLWRDLEVIVDSPLAARFTQVYRQLKPYWDKEAQRRLRAGCHPLSFDNLYTVDDHETHERTVRYLAQSGRPAVVIAASGMCAGGRVVNYLKAMLNDARHQVLFVGYQGAGTPGRDIQRYGPEGGWVELDGERIDIRAGITTINGYSAHADQRDLLNFIKRMRQWPKEVRLVHGDEDARRALKVEIENLAARRGHKIEVILPNT